MPAGHNGPASRRPLRNLSRRDYEHMIGVGILREDEHVELIGGRIVEMSPEGPAHAGASDLCANGSRSSGEREGSDLANEVVVRRQARGFR